MTLRVEGISKAFGGLTAVCDVSFAVREGERCAIIGPNGAGKTTLFNLLTGHLRPDGGRVYFRGEEITGLPPHHICSKKISRSFQRVSIFSNLSVFENIQVAVLASRRKTREIFSAARNLFREETYSILEAVGLGTQEGIISGTLSHGDQKRLELAIVLAGNPRLLLLDEPTQGMSPAETNETMALIDRITREKGLTLLFIEHDIGAAFAIAGVIRVMHEGRILAEGTPEQIRKNDEVQRVYLGERR
ncbi:MAG: ABC transporter ATP-binding protein [Syntrophales bacterium LBB04]|nr:ABC transporter ATP-binding protein [Syntrophales bacterium LBB04]